MLDAYDYPRTAGPIVNGAGADTSRRRRSAHSSDRESLETGEAVTDLTRPPAPFTSQLFGALVYLAALGCAVFAARTGGDIGGQAGVALRLFWLLLMFAWGCLLTLRWTKEHTDLQHREYMRIIEGYREMYDGQHAELLILREGKHQ